MKKEFIEMTCKAVDFGYIDGECAANFMANHGCPVNSNTVSKPMRMDEVNAGIEARLEFIARLTYAMKFFKSNFDSIYWSCMCFRSIGENDCAMVREDFEKTEKFIVDMFGDMLSSREKFKIAQALERAKQMCYRQTEELIECRVFYVSKFFNMEYFDSIIEEEKYNKCIKTFE